MSGYWVWTRCRNCHMEYGGRYFSVGAQESYDMRGINCCEVCGSNRRIVLITPFEDGKLIRVIEERLEC